VDLVDHEWLDERDGQTSKIWNPMYRDRIDIEVDLAEANNVTSTRRRSRRRTEWGEIDLASDELMKAFERKETSCGFNSLKRVATAHGH